MKPFQSEGIVTLLIRILHLLPDADPRAEFGGKVAVMETAG